MKHEMTLKRALAFVLALEMFCAPLAIARVQDPERAVMETPLGEEAFADYTAPIAAALPAESGSANSVTPATPLALDPGYYYIRMGFGIPTDGEGYMTEYDYYLNFEPKEDERGVWGSRGTNNSQDIKFAVPKDDELYTTLPDVGRVPDKELEGFYVAGAQPEGERWWEVSKDLLTWSFDETWFETDGDRAAYRLEEVAGDPVADYDFYNPKSGYDDVDVHRGSYTTVARIPYNSNTVQSMGFEEDYGEYYIPVVARWKASSKNDVTALDLTLTGQDVEPEAVASIYTEDPRGVENPAALDLADIQGDADREFWLRVSEDQESLTISFKTYEPYYNYNVKGEGSCPVTAAYTFHAAGGTVRAPLTVHSGVWDETAKAYTTPITPAPTGPSNYLSPHNTAEDPARGQWTIADIPLAKVDTAADPNADPFTTVTLTITAPDGETKTTYTLRIERLTSPVSTLGYGNTPYGMIAKDTSARWRDEKKVEGETEAETIARNKLEAKTNFTTYHTYQALDITPSGVLYSGEVGDQRTFTPTAWINSGVGNVDHNDSAVVAYLDMAFADPGVSFVDSEGRAVHFGDAAPADFPEYQDCVTRTIRLLVADDALTPDLYGATAATAGVSEVWYVGDEASDRLSKNEASQILHNANGNDVVDLRGLKVLPGIYKMVYTFADPVNNDVVVAERPLVVLPIPGDVDMDGAVTHADARVLQENRAAWDVASGSVFRLLRERVYNSDQVTVGDARGVAAIRNGFQPVVASGGHTDYFYRPLDTSSVYTRKTWDELTAAEGAEATLELRYLGPETGTRDERGHTNNISGPWKADPTQSVSLINEKHPNATDTFWVGVYLDLKSGSGLSGQAIRDLTLSLAYDSDYVEPAVVYPFVQNDPYTTIDAHWENVTYYSFNMGDHSTDDNNRAKTIFSGKSGNDYGREGTARSRTFVTHYSKVKGDLEQAAVGNSLRELVISLQSGSANPATLRSGCLLVLPFRLIKHPEGRLDSNNMARLIELSAGMRELTLITPTITTHALPGAAASRIEWMAQLMEASTGMRAVNDQTYAFSAQDTIYGDATENLRALVDCQPTDDGLILLGEDNTARTQLFNDIAAEKGKNARYDVEFRVDSGKLPLDNNYNSAVQPQGLPPGLVYYASDGSIRGIPTAASAPLSEPDADGNLYKPYHFTIGGNLYSIVVEPRTLRYTVDSRSTYYGEKNFRGMDSTDFTFHYTAADLADRDVRAYKTAYSAEPTGNGTELEDILVAQNYNAPGFFAFVQSTGGAAEFNTPVNESGYSIQVASAPQADNYRFEFRGNATLSILARPIYIDSILADYAAMDEKEPGIASRYNAQIYNNDNLTPRTHTVDESKGHGSLKLVLPATNNGIYNNLPLDSSGQARVGDDQLKITFSGRFQRNAQDMAASDNYIHLSSRQETRLIGDIGSVTLAADWPTNKNYTLATNGGDRTQSPADNSIQGIVLRCGINSIKITHTPAALDGSSIRAGTAIDTPQSLRVQLDLENNVQVGDFAYDVAFDFGSVSLLVWDLHYNWVSAAEMQAGLDNPTTIAGTGLIDNGDGTLTDAHPYGRDPLTTAMDGWYLCIAARKYDVEAGEEVEFVKTYSEHPLHVVKRSIDLTPTRSSRYYGDENNNLTYTYRWQDLSQAEQQWLKEYMGYGNANPKGTREELEALLAHHGVASEDMPQVAAMQTPTVPTGPDDPNLVKADTPRGSGNFYVVLYGGKSNDYAFRYTQSGAGTTTTSTEFGLTTFTIWPRPIVVSDLYSGLDATSGDHSTEKFATIYADTKTLFLENQVAGNVKTPFIADWNHVTFKTAGRNDKNQLHYYTHRNGTNGKDEITEVTPTGVDYADKDLAVLEKDRETLQVSYTVRFIPDTERNADGSYVHVAWNDFTNNYFSVESLTASGGEGQRPVEIGDLTLTGSAANNYTLVFDDAQQAEKQAPAGAEAYVAPEPGTRYTVSYQAYGTGTVILRPIENMNLTSLGKMSYTYGEAWAPAQPNGNYSLTLEVRYATHYDNDLANNTHTESLRYTPAVAADGTLTDNFTQRGFTIYYLGASSGGTTADKINAVSAGQSLSNGDPLFPMQHNNAKIFVVGKRGAHDPEIYSEVGAQPIKVRKAALTLTANSMHRFYGEANETAVCTSGEAFGYSYDVNELAAWDRSTALTDLEGYRAPTITTAAVPTSPINKAQWGEYEVAIRTFDFDNYVVTGEPGVLYIYPRPIEVTAITHSPSDPVYTIYNSTAASQFTTQYDSTEGRLTLGLPNVEGTTEYNQQLVNPTTNALGASHMLPLTGSALVGSDTLAFNASIEQADPSKWTLSSGATDLQVEDMIVTVNALAGENAKNYRLDSNYSQDKCWGAVKLRTIDHIHIMSKPKLDYTYGDSLDLTGLRVRIDYMKGDTESTNSYAYVSYVNPTQFQESGLYVNYWTVGDLVPTDSDARKSLTSRYRKADTGDHVTIAPTHDTQQYIGTNYSDPKMKPFAANGKTIIISAFQATTVQGNQSAAIPVILGNSEVTIHNLTVFDYTPTNVNTSGINSGINTAATIRVNPRRLTYTLTAEDKTYDGTTQAAGTVTLTNVFDATAQVQVKADNTKELAAIKDAVYLPIGAGYESASTNYASFTALTDTLRNGSVSFQTGVYQPNDPGLLAPNKAISWANGYTYGGDLLTFTFVNPNVHYEDEAFDTGRRPAIGPDASYDWTRSQPLSEVTSAHDVYNAVTALPVDVTNMKLMGPDAENYTWDEPNRPRLDTTSVRWTTRAAAQNGQAAAPFATIHKANRSQLQGRSALPSLAIDVHTNVLRLALNQDINALINELKDDFASEAHYEYALFYETDGLFATWAGDKGDFDHQDTIFFGGETVTPFIDPAYMPDLNRLTKPDTAKDTTIYKGQIYTWAKDDAGMRKANEAYPGGAEFASAYWYYSLYTTSRDPLPRNTVFYPLVRLSETHNFNPSADLSGDQNVTADSLEAAKSAVAALAADPENTALKAEAETASAAVLSAAGAMKDAAEKASQDKVKAEMERTESGKWDKDAVTDLPLTASAVKTFTQRLDLLTAGRERNTQGEDRTTEYLVTLVESVWFTDTQIYEEMKLLDSVVSNANPTRYYGYYWDTDYSAQLRIIKGEPIDLTGDFLATIRPKDGTGEREVNVNLAENGGRTAVLYVSTESGNGNKVRTITIVPQALYVRLGDAPYPLGVITDPPLPSNRIYQWTTSDPSVATVDENGLVTFRGLGEATITVSADNGKSASILVVVSNVLPLPEVSEPFFNDHYPYGWEELDENGAFRPYEPMTRAQLTVLMDIFLNPGAQWTATAELAYVDITGKERYYEALCRLTSVGIVEGIPGQAFAGDQLVTRAEFATMLCRMLQLEVPNTAGQIHMFEDAGQAETWAYAYIDALARTGVMRGVGGGKFAPNRVLTREESAAVISRLLVTRLTSDQEGHLKIPTDMTPANWSYEAVLRAINTIAFPD